MRKNLPRIFTVVRIIATLVLLYFIARNSHWSVFAFAVLSAFAIEGIAVTLQLHAKIILAQEKGMRAAMQSFDKRVEEFNKFVATINNQAAAVRKEMNRCRECENYPGVIRPGSIHNSAAKNCQMHKPAAEGKILHHRQSFNSPPRLQCPDCLANGEKNTQNVSGNCPIHD